MVENTIGIKRGNVNITFETCKKDVGLSKKKKSKNRSLFETPIIDMIIVVAVHRVHFSRAKNRVLCQRLCVCLDSDVWTGGRERVAWCNYVLLSVSQNDYIIGHGVHDVSSLYYIIFFVWSFTPLCAVNFHLSLLLCTRNICLIRSNAGGYNGGTNPSAAHVDRQASTKHWLRGLHIFTYVIGYSHGFACFGLVARFYNGS